MCDNPISVRVRTDWAGDIPRAKASRYLKALVDLIMALGGSNTASFDSGVGDPCWSVELWDGATLLVATPLTSDWPAAEGIKAAWEGRLRVLDAATVRERAATWATDTGRS